MAQQKLELTWYGKENEIKVEPRLLIENPKLSYKSHNRDLFSSATHENILIHGDNLIALKSLEKDFTNKIKCIYIDPPYNTGTAFDYYDDNLEHSIWLSLMRERVIVLRKLLSEDGVLLVQIDDNEYAYLKVLLDEIFGRSNYLNTISVKMKNIAGASGGGEDKRLKKNMEYILIYTKKYDSFGWVQNAYSMTEISELLKYYKDNSISWKYTSVIYETGEKKYITSTIDGDGNEIRIYERLNAKFKSISQLSKDENLSESEVYFKYIDRIHTTAMPQSSIRPRVMEKLKELSYVNDSLISIEYVPRSGKNKGVLYEQFYKGDKYRLITWLKDVVEIQNGKVYKKDLQGTLWDGINLNNLTKEGQVEFPKGKKPESLLKRIIEMTTNEGDIVLDSFLGSGTTVAVAHKLRRKWIGIELGEQAYTHCKVRIDRIIDNTDSGGITIESDWNGGGGYKFYELAPSLIRIDDFDQAIINSDYNADMLASAIAIHEGYKYEPDQDTFWKQAKNGDSSYLFTTTKHLDRSYLEAIHSQMNDDEFLVISCKSFESNIQHLYKNISIKKIPQSLLKNCEFGVDNYNLNIINPPVYEEDDEDE